MLNHKMPKLVYSNEVADYVAKAGSKLKMHGPGPKPFITVPMPVV